MIILSEEMDELIFPVVCQSEILLSLSGLSNGFRHPGMLFNPKSGRIYMDLTIRVSLGLKALLKSLPLFLKLGQENLFEIQVARVGFTAPHLVMPEHIGGVYVIEPEQ